MSEGPGQDQGLARFGHRHDYRVREIDTTSLIPPEEFERPYMLGVRRSIKDVGTVDQRVSEDEPCLGMSPRTQHEMNLDVDGPGDNHTPAK